MHAEASGLRVLTFGYSHYDNKHICLVLLFVILLLWILWSLHVKLFTFVIYLIGSNCRFNSSSFGFGVMG